MSKYCGWCMGKLVEEDGYCVYCGKKTGAPSAPGTLPYGTVLKDTYFIGYSLSTCDDFITYLAADVNIDSPVAIMEYFPRGANRTDDGLGVIPWDIGAQEYIDGMNSFIRKVNSDGVRTRELFLANNTAYVAIDRGIPLRHSQPEKSASDASEKAEAPAAETVRVLKPAEKKKRRFPLKTVILLAVVILAAAAGIYTAVRFGGGSLPFGQRDSATTEPAPAEEDAYSLAASAFAGFYRSYIDAINDQDPARIRSCTDEVFAEVRGRVPANARSTFKVMHIFADGATVEESDGAVSFYADCVTGVYDRASGDYKYENHAVWKATVSGGRVTALERDDEHVMSDDLRLIP